MNRLKHEKVRHAYILGAGFSVPLGGPVFNDLLSIKLFRFYNHLLLEHPPSVSETSWDFMKKLPLFINQARHTEEDGEGYNRIVSPTEVNAEQLLELMEAMAHGRTNWLCRLLQKEIKNLGSNELQGREKAKLALRLMKVRIAFEVTQFLQEVPFNSERWLPYQKWFSSLCDTDTIITTNYDPVVERLATNADTNHDLSLIHKDGQIRYLAPNSYERPPFLFKIHGSYDWWIDGDEIRRRPIESIADFFDGEIAIGTPGLSKSQILSGYLSNLWVTAKERLRLAHVVSIVGYSLPETDNFVRMEILDILGQNPHLKSVNIVLGSRNERGIRARTLVEQVTRYRADIKVRLLPIYAQDYLHAYRPVSVDEIECTSFEG